MDYLSFLTIRKRKNPQYPDLKGQDYMVLNSVSNLNKAIERLSHYERIHCFSTTTKQEIGFIWNCNERSPIGFGMLPSTTQGTRI